MNYSLGIYYDQDTMRKRHAVYCRTTQTWYFAKQYGRKSAQALCNRLNSIKG